MLKKLGIFILTLIFSINFQVNAFSNNERLAEMLFDKKYDDAMGKIKITFSDVSCDDEDVAEMLENSAYEIEFKYTRYYQIKKEKFSADVNVNIDGNKTNFQYFVDKDLSLGENSYITKILKRPDYNKYIVYKNKDIPQYEINIGQKIDLERLSYFNHGVINRLENPVVKKGNMYSCKVSAKEFTSILRQYYNYILDNTGERYDLLSVFANENLYGEDALEAEFVYDGKEMIRDFYYYFNFDTSVGELCKAFNIQNVDSESLDKEIKFKLKCSVELGMVNSGVFAVIPDLHPWNSVSTDEYEILNNFNQGENYIIYGDKVYTFDELGYILDEEKGYFPLRYFLNKLGVKNEEIVYSEGENSVTVQSSVAKFKIFFNDNKAEVNGAYKYLFDNMKQEDGTTFITMDFILNYMGFASNEIKLNDGGKIIFIK